MLSSDQARILWCLICAAGYYRPIDWQDCSLFLTHSPPRRGTVSLIRKAAVTLYRSDHIFAWSRILLFQHSAQIRQYLGFGQSLLAPFLIVHIVRLRFRIKAAYIFHAARVRIPYPRMHLNLIEHFLNLI